MTAMDNNLTTDELMEKLGIKKEVIENKNNPEYALEPYESVETEEKKDVCD